MFRFAPALCTSLFALLLAAAPAQAEPGTQTTTFGIPDTDGPVFHMLRIYNGGGLPGLIRESRECHQRPLDQRLECVHFDMVSQRLESTMAAKYNFRREPYFNDDNIRQRARPYFKASGFRGDLDAHLKQLQADKNQAVGRYVR